MLCDADLLSTYYVPGPVRGTENIKTSEISASGGMLSGAGLGCNRNSEEWHVAQSKRSEILTFELVDWDSVVSLLPPSPPRPQVFIYLEWTGALLSRQRDSPGRQRMHFRVWVKR